MLKSELLSILQREIRRHDFSYFIENPPSIAQGGNGVCVPGCPVGKVRINTMPLFLDHLANDVLPKENPESKLNAHAIEARHRCLAPDCIRGFCSLNLRELSL